MNIFFEKNQRFSDSILWKAQRDYYHKEGIKAWSTDVPFYVTSNPFIAHCYAQVAIRFLQDWARKHPESVQEPFYFLELGTGPGQFSYYILKNLLEIQSYLDLNYIKLCYIMSDFTEKNIEFWEQHESLKTYVEKGILDFAQFDLENDAEIHLRRSGITLKKDSIKNPLIVIANYIFDTLRNDVFKVSEGKLFESSISLSTTKHNLAENKPKDWEKIKIENQEKEIENNYYDNEIYNKILETYQTHFTETYFLFPIMALEAAHRLKMLSSGKMLLLSSDKAYSTLAEQDELDFPELAFHGSFSVMVNFDAISRAFKSWGGDALLQTSREGITTAAFTSGIQFSSFLETRFALEESIEGFSPGDYFLLHDQICGEGTKVSLEVYAALLCMSRWDPYVYDQVVSQICELLEEADYNTLEYLSKNMKKIAANFYFVPGAEDTLFNIGLFFHESEQYEQALPFYQESLRLYGELHVTLYNLAICYYELDNFEEAYRLFCRSLELDPKQKDARDWVKTLEEEMNRHS